VAFPGLADRSGCGTDKREGNGPMHWKGRRLKKDRLQRQGGLLYERSRGRESCVGGEAKKGTMEGH